MERESPHGASTPEPTPADEALDWDLEERDRLLAVGTLTDPNVVAPVETIVEADE